MVANAAYAARAKVGKQTGIGGRERKELLKWLLTAGRL